MCLSIFRNVDKINNNSKTMMYWFQVLKDMCVGIPFTDPYTYHTRT